MKGKIQLILLALALAACAPRLVRGPTEPCTRQFLYTEYATGRGGTLETHPVYGCAAATTQPITPGVPARSKS
jgi:hypothetical protein